MKKVSFAEICEAYPEREYTFRPEINMVKECYEKHQGIFRAKLSSGRPINDLRCMDTICHEPSVVQLARYLELGTAHRIANSSNSHCLSSRCWRNSHCTPNGRSIADDFLRIAHPPSCRYDGSTLWHLRTTCIFTMLPRLVRNLGRCSDDRSTSLQF